MTDHVHAQYINPGNRGRRVYIAGPMTGKPDFNAVAFIEAARRLRDAQYAVISPFEHDLEMGWLIVTWDSLGGLLSATKAEGQFDWNEALDWDLKALETCDAIYLLPGWSRSRGACKEYVFATNHGLKLMGAVNEGPDHVIVASEPLVGLVGYARSGKDTFAAGLGYRRLAFADKLKAVAVAANPRFVVPVWTHNDEAPYHYDLSEIVEEFGWEYAKSEVPGVREFLQRLGTEAVRVHLGDNAWVEAAMGDYDPSQPTVFTDVRFPNEVEAIRGRGGIIVRLTREGLKPPNVHVSEQLVETIVPDFDFVAPWSGIPELRAQAEALDAFLRHGGPDPRPEVA